MISPPINNKPSRRLCRQKVLLFSRNRRKKKTLLTSFCAAIWQLRLLHAAVITLVLGRGKVQNLCYTYNWNGESMNMMF